MKPRNGNPAAYAFPSDSKRNRKAKRYRKMQAFASNDESESLHKYLIEDIKKQPIQFVPPSNYRQYLLKRACNHILMSGKSFLKTNDYSISTIRDTEETDGKEGNNDADGLEEAKEKVDKESIGKKKQVIPKDKEENNTAAIYRYYQDSKLVCLYCNSFKHITQYCPKLADKSLFHCLLCGSVSHLLRNCPYELCHRCNKRGHNQKQCPRKHFITCRHCEETGHIEKNCITYLDGRIHEDELKGAVCMKCGKSGHIVCNGKGNADYKEDDKELYEIEVGWSNVATVQADDSDSDWKDIEDYESWEKRCQERYDNSIQYYCSLCGENHMRSACEWAKELDNHLKDPHDFRIRRENIYDRRVKKHIGKKRLVKMQIEGDYNGFIRLKNNTRTKKLNRRQRNKYAIEQCTFEEQPPENTTQKVMEEPASEEKKEIGGGEEHENGKRRKGKKGKLPMVSKDNNTGTSTMSKAERRQLKAMCAEYCTKK